MIIERIIKALLKRKITCSLELIYSHSLVSGITSLSMLLLMRPESTLLAGIAKSLVLKKCFGFCQEIRFTFFYKWGMHITERLNIIIKGKTIIL